MKRYFFLSFLTLILNTQLFAQQFPTQGDRFGKNRVQYQDFDWKYVSSDNFEIYYYKGGYEMALLTARYAELEMNRLTELLGFAPYSRIKIFVYHSVGELQQSNIGVSDQEFKIGGQTNLGKSVVEIAFSDYREAYRQELLREISDALLSEMMYGGNLKETLQSSFLLSLPDWFMAGAAAYASEGWSTKMDNFVRSNLADGEIPYPDSFQDKNARLIGHSIWNYIVEEYGKGTVSNILNLTRIVRSEKAAIEGTIGVPYESFLKNWRTFYQKQYEVNLNRYYSLDQAQEVIQALESQSVHHPRLSPDGSRLAYAINNQGKYKVYWQFAEGVQKAEKVAKGGLYVINQRYDEESPLIDWRNNEEVGVISYIKNRYFLLIYNLKGKELERYAIKNVEAIQSFDFDSKGRNVVLSATDKGRSNIYQYSLSTKRLTSITNDTSDDIDPRFLPDDKSVVFSSNRKTDSLQASPSLSSSPHFNIFIYNPSDRTKLKRVINQSSIALKPLPLSASQMLYLNEELGIKHVFLYDLDKNTNEQLSTFFVDIDGYDYHPKSQKLAFVATKKGTQTLFLNDLEAKHTTFTGKTVRSQLLGLRYLQKLRQEEKQNRQENNEQGNEGEEEQIPEKVEEQNRQNAAKDTTKSKYDFDTFDQNTDTSQPTRRKRLLKDYDYFAQRASDREDRKITVRGPMEYQNKFAFDRSITTIALDPLRNFGLLIEMEMTDALENHKIRGGLFNRGFFDIQSGMLFAEYQYLKKRMDFGARFDRQGYELFTDFFIHRYYLNRLAGIISYPFNVTTRVSVSPFVAQKQFFATSEVNPAVQAFPSKTTRYGGLSAEFVFDNSIITGPNTREGSRFKANVDHYQGINFSEESFTNIFIDARHYIPLGRRVTLAGRFAYGKSFGRKPKNFRLGGVDNWVFQRQPSPDELPQEDPFYLDNEDPLSFRNDYSDYLFLRYATPMRGFDYNKLTGNNFLLTNIELRVPVAQLFYEGTIRSSFFQNLQMVVFNDIGSAWTGISPFNRENALNTVEIGGEPGVPFFAKVSNFKDPFLWGYGLGVRSKILNYFTRFDIAWGVEDEERTSARYYLSIGYDF